MCFTHEGMKRLRHEAFAEQTKRCLRRIEWGEHCSSGYRVRLLLNRKISATTKVVECLWHQLLAAQKLQKLQTGQAVCSPDLGAEPPGPLVCDKSHSIFAQRAGDCLMAIEVSAMLFIRAVRRVIRAVRRGRRTLH